MPELAMPFIRIRYTRTQAMIKQRTFQYLIPPTSSNKVRFDQRFQPLTVFLPILLVESRTVLNQKYCVSLEFSHSATVTLSSVRGQADQGRES